MVVMPKQNVPALRLEGFDGEWETGLAREIFVETDDRGYPGLPVLSATQTSGMVPRSMMDYAIQHNRENEVGYKRVCVGDFVVHLRSFQGGFAHSYYEGITSPAYHVFRARERSHQDDRFWRFVFSSSRFIHQLHFVTFGIRDGKSISFPEFLELSLRYAPTLDEQQAIGAIFTNLDAAINQHTLKHKALQQAKTALMQRMFPQEGQTAPELRLEGFDGEWCIKSLDELATVKSAARVHREQWRDSGVPFFRASDVSAVVNGVENEKAFISHELYEELSAKSGKLRKGDLLVIGGGSIGTTYQVPNDGPLYSKDADVLWVQPNANVSSDYLETFFGSLLLEKYLKSISHAGTIAHYTIIQAKRTLVPTPPTLAEQQAIGAVFTNLDQLIAAEAQYIKSLSQAKTALLQRMFI